MSRFMRAIVLGLIAWGGALYGILGVSTLSGNWGHGVCGPWGCGPPLQAVVAWHGFWVFLFAPPVVWAIGFGSGSALRRIGAGLAGVAAVGLAIVGVWDWATWPAELTNVYGTFLIQRYLFVVATLLDVPLVPLLAAGLALLIAGMKRQKKDAACALVVGCSAHERHVATGSLLTGRGE